MVQAQRIMATYFRMNNTNPIPKQTKLPKEMRLVPYRAEQHQAVIPEIYARAFGEPPWPDDWDKIPEFDPQGVFLAQPVHSALPAGFVISFMRGEFGYISVVAVVPAWRRQGIASALIQAAAAYLYSQQASYLQIDVEENNLPAQKAYRKLGFEVIKTFQDPV
jgi:ribosomal protein S18 acetylase RimI-like enzyme